MKEYIAKEYKYTPVSYTHLDVYKRQVQKIVFRINITYLRRRDTKETIRSSETSC